MIVQATGADKWVERAKRALRDVVFFGDHRYLFWCTFGYTDGDSACLELFFRMDAPLLLLSELSSHDWYRY